MDRKVEIKGGWLVSAMLSLEVARNNITVEGVLYCSLLHLNTGRQAGQLVSGVFIPKGYEQRERDRPG